MNRFRTLSGNEEGSAIVLALIILAVVTIIAISSSSTSTVESQIVRNQRIYQQNFYFAESSAYEVAQRIQQENNPEDQLIVVTTGFDWLNQPGVFDFSNPGDWNDAGPGSGIAGDNSDVSVIDPSAALSAEGRGVRPGSSLDLGGTRLYDFSGFGISQWNNGRAIIEVGYLRRF